MVTRKIPAGRYAIFTSDVGAVEKVVPATWQTVWGAGLQRAYNADFELYDGRARDPKNAQVDICVGIK